MKPEAQSYYELGAATLKFTFPDPAPLDGVTSRQKSILNMKKVSVVKRTRKEGVDHSLSLVDFRSIRRRKLKLLGRKHSQLILKEAYA